MWKENRKDSLHGFDVDEQRESIYDLQSHFTQMTRFEEIKENHENDQVSMGASFDLGLSRHNWFIICEYLLLIDLVNLTSLCKKSFTLLSHFPIKNRIQLNPRSRKWIQRSNISLDLCRNIRIQEASSASIMNCCFSRSNHLIITSADRTFSVWDLTVINIIGNFITLPSTANALCALPEPTHIAMGMFDGAVRVYDVLTKDLIKSLRHDELSIISICLDLEDRLLVGTVGKTIVVWDLEKDAKIHTMTNHLSIITSLILEKSGNVISASFDARIKIWDTRNGKIIHTILTHASVNCLTALSQGGFASGSYDSSIDIWFPCDMFDVVGGPYKLSARMYGRGHLVRSLSQITEDKIVSGDHDRAINVWSIKKAELLESHFVHEDWVYDISPMPFRANLSIVSVSADRSFSITALDDEFNIQEPAPFDYESLWAVSSENSENIYVYDEDFGLDDPTNAQKLWNAVNGSQEM